MKQYKQEAHKHHQRSGFYIIYAVLFIFSIALACAFYYQQGYHRTSFQGYTHAKAQLELYAQSVHKAVILCLKSRDIHTCEIQRFHFVQGYEFRTSLIPLASHTFALDIHGSVSHPSSSNTLRLSRRYILYIKSQNIP